MLRARAATERLFDWLREAFISDLFPPAPASAPYVEHWCLFAGTMTTKVGNTGDSLVRWHRGRLRNAFGHVTTARELGSTSGRPLYYLIFAGPNKTGAVIAQNVLKQGTRTIR